jgi:uncharacterized protein (TIGR03083 family)
MDRSDYLAALASDGAALLDACAAAGPTAAVAACPDWTVSDLLWHVAEVHHFWRTVVAEELPHWDRYTQPPRPADDELPSFAREGLAATIEVLAAADPATAVWTWSDDKTVAFVIRRMAHETMIHRWDAEVAAGLSPVLDPSMASDGIDEFLAHFVHDAAEGAAPVAGSVHIHCGDVPGEWTIREAADGSLAVTREHAKGDCAIRGAAADILLALWRRTPLAAVDVVGDAAVAARFVARPSLS